MNTCHKSTHDVLKKIRCHAEEMFYDMEKHCITDPIAFMGIASTIGATLDAEKDLLEIVAMAETSTK